MDLNFCTICYQETNGDLYCSSSCRQADTPSSSTSPSSSSTSTSTSSLSPSSAFLFPLAERKSSPTSAFFHPPAFSGSSEEDEDEDFFSTDFQLPNKRNLAHIRAAGAIQSRGARPLLPREGNISARGARFGGAAGVRGADDDVETEVLMALTKPLSLEHRHRAEPKFAGRAKYPAAF